ncbi:MAG: dihydrolipoyl dehydrogenase [Thermodesulfovibrionales bacterium]
MKEYDVIVVGAGEVGLAIVFKALSEGANVALIEKGKVGGTCVNVGCVPSKMLLFPADRIVEIEEAGKLGIRAKIIRKDFRSIMERMKRTVQSSQDSLKEALKDSKNLTLYQGEGQFVSDYTLAIKNKRIRGRRIFIASGSRPFIPPLKGLDSIEYLTNESLLRLKKKPKSMIIIGGGFIAVEYGHFFSAMGVKVTMVQRHERLVPHEEPEIADLLKRKMEKRMEIYTSAAVSEVGLGADGYVAVVKDQKTGEERQIATEKILLATGRRSNADLLRVENTGVETDESFFIRVDDYLRTNKENIWALGDAIGRQMFTHAGDKEAEIAWHNATHDEKRKMDFHAVPHAVFTYPQIASVGLTEEQARKDYEIMVGKARYSDTVKGEAMMEEEGFAKGIMEKNTERILGFHIIGPEASILIQEVVNVVASKGDRKSITESMHIFPALSDLVTETLNNGE